MGFFASLINGNSSSRRFFTSSGADAEAPSTKKGCLAAAEGARSEPKRMHDNSPNEARETSPFPTRPVNESGASISLPANGNADAENPSISDAHLDAVLKKIDVSSRDNRALLEQQSRHVEELISLHRQQDRERAKKNSELQSDLSASRQKLLELEDEYAELIRRRDKELADLTRRLLDAESEIEALILRVKEISAVAASLAPKWSLASRLLHVLGFGPARSIARTGKFDAEAYLAANPDVAADGADPLFHYLLHGIREGRTPSGKGMAGAEALGTKVRSSDRHGDESLSQPAIASPGDASRDVA